MKRSFKIVDAFDQGDRLAGFSTLRQELVQPIPWAEYHVHAQLAAAGRTLKARQP
jgi:hypothetical protein